MVHDLMVALFATAAGFTVSGILSNVYALILSGKELTGAARTAHYAVMVVAGPNVLLERAAASVRAKTCSKLVFWLAAAGAAYWSFAIGLFVLDLWLAL
ncbi:MAG TPA: hypothetical protein VG843_03850 [Rhizomicrobium sp.]|jgi:hypothetical protein|nr:hypothetical protein [Rhizomicrobium sp.]